MGWRPDTDPVRAALMDLAEFGWVTVPSRRLAEQLHKLAVAAGQSARIVPGARGWWRVEITDMRSREPQDRRGE